MGQVLSFYVWVWRAKVFFSVAHLTGALSLCLRQDDKEVGRADRGALPPFIMPWEVIPRNQLSAV